MDDEARAALLTLPDWAIWMLMCLHHRTDSAQQRRGFEPMSFEEWVNIYWSAGGYAQSDVAALRAALASSPIAP